VGDETTIRQRLMDDIVQTLLSSGVVVAAADSEPWDYSNTPVPYAWVYEGDEQINNNSFVQHITCTVPVMIQVIFNFESAIPERRLHPLGRKYLAKVEQAMMKDYERGTNESGQANAFFTLEGSNQIAEVEGVEGREIGVVMSRWQVRYFRNRFNPYRQ